MTYQINTNKILFTQLGDEGVVYNTQANEYVTLNETFFKILQGVEANKTQVEIVTSLCDEYEISEDDCQKEVTAALAQLAEKEYICQ